MKVPEALYQPVSSSFVVVPRLFACRSSAQAGPEAARRAYLLQLQRNGPEVPPDLYAKFTQAYDILKSPGVWSTPASDGDSLDDLKREAAERRARRGCGARTPPLGHL